MAKIDRQPEAMRLNFQGVNIVYPPDTQPPGKFPVAVNVRAYQGNAVGPRLPQGVSVDSSGASTPVHSLMRLNDNNVSPGYGVWVFGWGTHLSVGNVEVAHGFSGNRLGMASYRPSSSPAPWMYIADTSQAIKTNAETLVDYNTGIAEPQTPALPFDGGPSSTGPTYPVYYQYKFRSTVTGAVSNPSPPMLTGFNAVTGHCPAVAVGPASDPQVDTIDIYRQDVGLLNMTYVASVGASQTFPTSIIDNLTDEDLASNPLMQYDDYEPYPSIDLPHSSVVSISGSSPGPWTLTWSSGQKFNTRWLPGTIVTGEFGSFTLYVRPTSETSMQVINNPNNVTSPPDYGINIFEPILAAQRLPTLWGPTDNAGYFFSVGDPLRPGTLYFTKGNNPDSAPDTNQIEVTSPSEPLINGAIVNGIGVVLSTERGWLIYPNFAQAVSTVIGVQGSPFQVYETIQGFGLYAKEGICTDGGANMFFWSKEGIRVSQGGLGSQSLTDNDLFPLFPHEGQPARSFTLGSYTVNPPDYTNPNSFCLRWAEGYLYADYQDASSGWWTLVYDTVNKAWSVDQYEFPASIHADTQGQGIGTVTGCTDGNIRPLSPTGVETGNMVLGTPSFDAGDLRATKRFADLYLEAAVQSGDVVSIDLWLARYTVHQNASLSQTTLPSTAGVRTGVVVDLLAGLGVYTTDLALVFTVPLAQSPASLLYAWQPSLVPQPETIHRRAMDWDDAGTPGAKFVQGCIIQADTANVPKIIAVENGDDLSIHTAIESPAAFNGQSLQAFSFAQPFVAHNMRLVPQDVVPARIWNVKWIFVPFPEIAENWQTELISHGLKGWQHIKEINVPYLSTTPLTLTLTPDPQSYAIPTMAIPSSNGLQQKLLIIAPPNKFKLMGYAITGAAPFRLWKEDIEVKIRSWGSNGAYSILKPWGGPSSPGADV